MDIIRIVCIVFRVITEKMTKVKDIDMCKLKIQPNRFSLVFLLV